MRKALISILMVATLIPVGSQAARAADAPDWVTTLKVKLELLTKLGVDALHIDVDTTDGQVQLAGTVEKRETRDLAGELASKVDGVRSVENDVRLESAQQNPSELGAAEQEAKAELADAVLETRVRLKLIDQLGSDGLRIGTEASNGVVTLEFAKEMPERRRNRAVAAVQGIHGVTKVLSVDKS
jgi:osmotically-inducible protein OsmY